MALDVLIIGAGAREHALAWKIAQSPKVAKVYIAPGNAGTEHVGVNVPIAETDFEKLARFASEKQIGLTIVGGEASLALGIVDYFKARDLRIWGPMKAAAQIESSKAFAKKMMHEASIPTADFNVASDFDSAIVHARRRGLPVVVKASGLTDGKGVYICASFEEVESALKALLIDKVHGRAGSEVIIEEYLEGAEISAHALCDGINFVLFPASQGFKRALDGDQGKNTDGMGAIAPVPWITAEQMTAIELHVVRPTLEALARLGTPFTGMLDSVLMVSGTGVKVLGYNVSFGDPETQAYMRILGNDLMDLLEASLDGTLGNHKLDWRHGFATNVVLTSAGYPEQSGQDRKPITGVEYAERDPNVVVFHAGTTYDGQLKAVGGRVLSVTTLGSPLKQSIELTYEAIKKIHFEGMEYRKDIGAKSMQ